MPQDLTATLTLYPTAELGGGIRHFMLLEHFRPSWIYAGPGTSEVPGVSFASGQGLAGPVALHLANSGLLTELIGIDLPEDGREPLEITADQETLLYGCMAGRPSLLVLLPGSVLDDSDVTKAVEGGWPVEVVDQRDVEIIHAPSS